jgi:hypothetical protein
MVCKKCGTQLFREANYCWKCGEKVVADLDPDAQSKDERQYESCQIDYIDRGLGGAWYECRVGTNVIARSPKKDRFSDQHPMFLDLVSKLLEEGWEPVSSDEEGNPVTLRRAKK